MYGSNDFGNFALFDCALLSSKSACKLYVSLTSLTYVTMVTHNSRYHIENVFSRTFTTSENSFAARKSAYRLLWSHNLISTVP